MREKLFGMYHLDALLKPIVGKLSVQHFTVVDNSDFSPTRLTVPLDAFILPYSKKLSLLPNSNGPAPLGGA